MIYAKANPIGIDFMIDNLQTKLSSLAWSDKHIYGRLYLNTKSNGKILAEAHISDKNYKDIFIDNSKAVVIGFVERGDVSIDATGKIQTSTIDVVCSTILDKIYTTTERKDEEALQQVLQIIQKTAGWHPEKIRKGNVKDVFNFMDTSSITFRDMQPYANFAISCKVNYLNNICKL